MSETPDAILPADRWVFDEAVTDAFGDMLRRSVPQLDLMRQACFEVGRRFVKEGSNIVDLGCSRGDALAPFVEAFGQNCSYFGIEVAGPMITACRERFAGCPAVKIWDMDLRGDYPPVRASLTLSVLTLQFTPIEHRQRIVRNIWRRTEPGGAVILVEKVLGATADLDAIFVDSYYDLKRQAGYTEEQIQRKRMALEGVLVPVTWRWNLDLLTQAGFTQVDSFWRLYNFAGWVGVKD